MTLETTPRARAQSLGDALSSHDNAFGFLRLAMALLVIVDHAFPLGGFGDDPMWRWSKGQESFGGFAVAGFFAISGFLIAKSSLSNDPLQFLWRRGLRILPAFWAVLCVAAFLVGPVIWKLQGLGLRTYFTNDPLGPFAYVKHNFFLEIGRYCIYDIYAATPYGLQTKGSALNGSLWTLIYEWHCYLLVLLFAVGGLLRRARPFVVVLAIGLLVFVNLQRIDADAPGKLIPVLHDVFNIRFTCIFLLGSVAAVYAKEIPLDDRLGALSLAAFGYSVFRGGWFLFGYPAFVYLLLWLAVRLPKSLRAIGSKNDYSYGIYLYGFLVEQTLAYFGAYKGGVVSFIILSMAATFPCAFLSWHLLEKRAMGLKDYGPGAGVQPIIDWLRAKLGGRGKTNTPDSLQRTSVAPLIPIEDKPDV